LLNHLKFSYPIVFILLKRRWEKGETEEERRGGKRRRERWRRDREGGEKEKGRERSGDGGEMGEG
jgi:hypothetical protein